MPSNATNLPFDPAGVRSRIHELREQAQGLETLLRSYGLDLNGQGDIPVMVNTENVRTRTRRRRLVVSRRRRTSRRPVAVKPQGPKLSDGAFEVLAEHNWRAHGKVIVQEMLKRGLMKGVAHPDSNISTALSRDERFERDPEVKNTWIVRKEHRQSA